MKVVDSYELSPLQAGMLFHAAGGADPGVDIEQVVATLQEPLDEARFLRAWQRVVERHAILRTRFRWEGLAQPVQEVLDHVDVNFERFDCLETMVRESRLRGFDPAQAPLMRLALAQTGDTQYQLVWTFHHLLLDGHSRLLLLQELFALYDDSGSEPAKAPPYRHYVDWLRGVDSGQAKAYWKRALAGFRAPTPLTVCRAREAQPPDGGTRGMRECRLPAGLTTALRRRARAAGITLNLLLQGAWALLLHRYSAESDIVFGVTRASRPSKLPGATGMVGLLVNTLPMRIAVDPEAGLMQWLQGLAAQHRAMSDHEQTPLVQVQAWSEVARGTPLFESLFVFDRHTLDAGLRAEGGCWGARRFATLNQTNYPLTVAAYGDDELLLQLQYSRRRFEDGAVERMLAHLRTLLEGIAAGDDARLKELPLLTEAELGQLADWNRTAAAYPPARCLHELVEDQARRHPHALAAEAGERRVAYGELDARAQRLAARLRAHGVRQGSLVAVHLERSIDMLVALLAVWKAGAAYVPIDRQYPAERVRFMLEDSGARLLLTEQTMADLDAQIADPLSGESFDPQSLAYVIYTSGSTGVPKGVPITHASLFNLVCWHQRAYGVGPADRATQIAGPGFDATVWEIWPYLAAGASVHVPGEATRVDAALLLRWLAEQRITLAFLPTPLAEAALREAQPGSTTLRVLLTGGDRLTLRPAQGLPFRLVNHYGPTENTVVSTCADVPVRAEQDSPPPIGRPLPNTQAHVVDRHLQPVPIGVPGELLVGGAQLSPGYWNRPGLTAERFIEHPAKGRLYRTGDLVRLLPDGNIEFLGRIDDQVKIRGYRIEPGEIEAAIARHPAVREAVVLAREDTGSEKRLVAYVTARGPAVDIAAELRTLLLGVLPEYMIPAHIVTLETLPLTPHGKVDRKALPAPAGAPRSAPLLAPRTPTEALLERAWAEILGLDSVGVEDDFFELGGHSLLAMRVVSRLRQAFGVELAVRELFAAPTVAGLAARIDAQRAAPAAATPLAIAASPPGPGELSYSQQRLWLLDQLQPGTAAYAIPAAIEISGPLNRPALERALRELAGRHEALRTVFMNAGGRPFQLVTQICEWTLPVTDVHEADLSRLMREEAACGFDLSRGPLFRGRLYRLAAERHVLLLLVHHIVSDGWSMGILSGELGELYAKLSRGEAPALPPLRCQYRDYARWQRARLQGGAVHELLSHWRSRLAGVPQVLELPTDRPRPPVESNRGATFAFALPPAFVDELRAFARREGATLFMTLLAGFSLLLSRYSGQEDLVVGTPVANRSASEIEDVVGCFVNILVLRADLSGDPTVGELVARTRETCLDAYAHQELPFDRLVEDLQPSRDLSRNPVFQVMFALHNAPDRPLEMPGLALRDLQIDTGTAKVDLALQLQETAQGLAASFEYATDLFDEASIARMAAHWRVLLEGMLAAPRRRVRELPLLTSAEEQQLSEWNRTGAACPAGVVHAQIEAQVERTPESIALVFEDTSLTYRALNERANRLAARLIELGVGPDRLVGIQLPRSLEMVIAVLAVLKAGGAYVPLDPAFPDERIAYMAKDAGLQAVITEVDEGTLGDNPVTAVGPGNLAYVIYTSGSTGRPKGVMVEHRNVTSFFAAMDACIDHDPPGTWLAVTSLSFDISVLELLWTLARGFKVVVQGNVDDYFAPAAKLQGVPLGFSLFMWGNDDAPGRDKYRLMLEGAKYFDRNGFEAVWTPERHFHAFGGPYPNPSVTGAALAAVTERLGIRAGSCVSPLHHPIRIAEEWAVVDNLSNGRVALAFASGWQPNDFVLRPENHARNKAVMLEQIDQVRRLWRGEKLNFRNPLGKEVAVATLPRPVQAELPFWVTSAGNPDTYRQAGELGANVLTHLLGQSIEEVAEKISVYRQARAAAGHDAATGRVTLMLHTLVGRDDDEVRELVRQPMKDYLKSSLKLMVGFAWSFANFKRPDGAPARAEDVDIASLAQGEVDALLDFAFERYFETSGLFGSPATCARMVERCKQAGVDEIACLLDFGVPTEQALASLPWLNRVRAAADPEFAQRFSVAAQIERHGVTHLQCTPSLARMLLLDGATRVALGGIRQMLVGGEALPAALAQELKAAVGGELRNMYGPTETTVWSTTHEVDGTEAAVPIGRPIANTQAYILDRFGQRLPAGVPGELALGGAGVTRGYLNRAGLTAQRFVDRLYRTGDMARFLPDGRIEYLGRADGQVKIRGQRVELGEIESLLAEHPAVAQAAVALHADRVVAYFVETSGIDAKELKDWLRRQLPEHMLPASFVKLERMPFTPNGKLDRKALPAPEHTAAAPVEYVAPATPTEQALVELWQPILGIERVGARDNFFDSGGHSLLAMQLVGRVRERFGVDLRLKSVFERPTLGGLAEAIDALSWLQAGSEAPHAAAGREETVL